MTAPGQPTPRPAGTYAPGPAVDETVDGVVVRFHGEDGRTHTFSLVGLPLPEVHADLAAAFARRTGPDGSLRTLASATGLWWILRRFVRFLAGLPRPPRTVRQLTSFHLGQFRLHRATTMSLVNAEAELGGVLALLEVVTPRQQLRPEVVELFGRRRTHPRSRQLGAPGYSEREFRQVMAAARGDVAAIRDRLRAAEQLLARAWTRPQTITDPRERRLAVRLLETAMTGEPARILQAGRTLVDGAAMKQLAKQLFLVHEDLAPLLVLGVGLTGRNGETLKELPAAHQVLDGRAVAVEVVKRRRGPDQGRGVAHWEVGRPSRQLHTPGGYYLLLEAMTRRSRSFSRTPSAWSVWLRTGGHQDPFQQHLGRYVGLKPWADRHDLRDDDGQPLVLNLNRLKTTVEVRTTKTVGGHLPSAARTNTMDVLFANYLRGDPTVLDWAADEVTAALADAQRQARQAHLRVLTGTGTGSGVDGLDPAQAAAELDVSHATARQALDGGLDTAFAACLDIYDSPFGGDNDDGRCGASFLICLRCPNALVTGRHLPGLLGLLDELEAARQTMDLETWRQRYGQAWLAITNDVLPKFTPAEIAAAEHGKPATALLGLLEPPREQA